MSKEQKSKRTPIDLYNLIKDRKIFLTKIIWNQNT